ncbi:MAG: acyl-CoA dehydrogenase [Acidimicrobiia bacterium]|jgi:alkylation response protein AidB-like acyl-CoA dehydrogenase
MRFAFTEDQLEFRDAVRDLLANECPPGVVRAAWENADGRSGAAWAALAEMGVLGAGAPEDRGGLGFTVLDLVLIAEETGYVALPEPFVEHAVVAMAVLPDDAAEAAGAGETLVTAALGGAAYVPYVGVAGLVLTEEDDALVLVARDALVVRPETSVDGTRRLGWIEWDEAEIVGEADDLAAAFDRGVLGTAAQLIGLTRRMLDLTVEYVKEREQFGVPIGSFQAVKHHLADARIALEFARPLVYRAAWSMAEGEPDAPVHVSMAKALASDAATLTARRALQCHGAMGYSFEYDLHLYMKRAWALAASWGDPAWHRARVGRAIL